MIKNAQQQPTILLFDSGIGGLSIYQDIQQCLPTANYLYLLDNQCFPYGEKSESFVAERVSQLLHIIVKLHTISLIVIACNTASTAALLTLRQQLAIPIVGVVPAIKPAAQLTRNGVIGLLATNGTVKRDYTQQLITEFAPDCQVKLLGSAKLVECAEAKLHGQAFAIEDIRSELQPWLALSERPDTVILGCTHFPFLKPELAQILPEQTQFIDSGGAVAKRVAWLLTQQASMAGSIMENNIAYCTAFDNRTATLSQLLASYQFSELRLLS